MRAIKRSFALALCLCLLLGSCGTLAESFSARQIDFCKEYVNLRERPDSKSRSLGQVYIGEVVVAAPYDDAFSYCCYNGQYPHRGGQLCRPDPRGGGRRRLAGR